jgi:hypothetical protein
VVARPSPDPETVAALLDTTWKVAANERERTYALDRTAASLATFASLVLSLLAVFGRELLRRSHLYVDFGLFAASLTGLVLALAMAVKVLLPREDLTVSIAALENFPKWSEILKPRIQVQGEVMSALVITIAAERAINGTKARDIRMAFLLLLAGLLFVAAASVVFLAKEVFAAR